MSAAEFTTYVVDDNPAILKALGRLLRGAGYDVRPYRSPETFLAEHDPQRPGCAILDVSMPTLDGREVHKKLRDNGWSRPVIFLTGHGNIPMGVKAIQGGAIDFLTKPVQRDALLHAIQRASEQDEVVRRSSQERHEIEAKLAKLTPREREVMGHVVAGRLNKQIAADLGTVEKTIKVHRSRMMAKLGLRAVADLVRLTEKANSI
jgi:FixJ family two-component response regulator